MLKDNSHNVVLHFVFEMAGGRKQKRFAKHLLRGVAQRKVRLVDAPYDFLKLRV